MAESVTEQRVPVLTKERFADLVGVSVDVVRGWVARGLVPTVRLGRRRLINVAALQQELKNA
jgi:excisionase family DNA binding protein